MRGILFDKDGTLLDFEASWSVAFRELASDLAAGDLAEVERMLVAGGLDQSTGTISAGSVLGAGNTRDIVDLWFPHLDPMEFAAMVEVIDAAFYRNGVTRSVPVPGLSETLMALAEADIAMGVATSDGTAGTRAALQALGIDRHLPHVFGYDSVARPKPAPDIVFAFCEAIGATPAEIAVVGDNPHDLEMARAAGAGVAVGVLTGNSSAAVLGPLADCILASVADLPDWLRTRT